MRMIPCFLGLLLICLTACQAPEPQYGVAYITDRDGNFDIYFTDELGDTHQKLTDNPGMDWSPKWDKANDRIIHYASDTSGNFSILSRKLSGEELQLETAGLKEFILSPKGNMALFTLKDSVYKHIFALDLQTKDTLTMVDHPSYNGSPKWSPDGEWVSFISDRHGNNELFAIRVADGELKRLTYTPGREKYTSWSGEGDYLYYTMSAKENQNNIFRVKLSTAETEAITSDTLLYEEIACSPDGTQLAYHAKRDCEHHIFVMKIDGSEERKITFEQAYHGEPEWIILPESKEE
ncbi:MAG: hypothetical protein AAGC85_06050 [Bacteroidota bacterium]